MERPDPGAALLAAFEAACAAGALDVAGRVLEVLEMFILQAPVPSRQRLAETLVESHERLWGLRVESRR